MNNSSLLIQRMTVWNTQLTFTWNAEWKLTNSGQNYSLILSKDTCWNGYELIFSISSPWQTEIPLEFKYTVK